jgi:glutamate N-acetyltransferase/amino-acid N-acetyltransferase
MNPLSKPVVPAFFSVPVDTSRTITDIAGVRVGVAEGAIKKPGRDDVVLIDAPGVAAGVTTRSSAAAAPCLWTRALLPGRARAVVVNAGNANAATGAQGERDVLATAERVAAVLGCPPREVLVCSTGVIGVPMPIERLLPAVERAAQALGAHGHRAARAILTTDLVAKEAFAEVEGIRVAGIAKGSGMIHPNMATMLAFLATDAVVEADALQAIVSRAAARTFDAITVDGDTSTNDTLIVQATGQGRAAEAGAGLEALEVAISAVCRTLARAIARDGEGATRLVEVLVEGTASDAVAMDAARAVARSPLVKTAIHGCDPNWGRVVGALGAAGVPGLSALDLDLGGVPVLRAGAPVPVDEAVASAAIEQDEVRIHARLPGPGLGWAWGCDLTDGYVRINADYRS